MDVACTHHQAALAQKSAILSAEGVATGLVRMCNCMKSSAFEVKATSYIDSLVQRMDRREVLRLPSAHQTWSTQRERIIEFCRPQWKDSDKDLICTMLNSNWSEPLQNGQLVHWCAPGCCRSDLESRRKMRQALQVLLMRFPDTPLLYRWKHFRESACFAFITCFCHSMWPSLLSTAVSVRDIEEVANIAPDELQSDNADISLGQQQKVRLVKTLKLFSNPDIVSVLAETILLTRPLANYMDVVSCVNTRQDRLGLRQRGLTPSTKSGQSYTLEEYENSVVAAVLEVVTGQTAVQVVSEYIGLMEAGPADDNLLPFLKGQAPRALPGVQVKFCFYFRCWSSILFEGFPR